MPSPRLHHKNSILAKKKSFYLRWARPTGRAGPPSRRAMPGGHAWHQRLGMLLLDTKSSALMVGFQDVLGGSTLHPQVLGGCLPPPPIARRPTSHRPEGTGTAPGQGQPPAAGWCFMMRTSTATTRSGWHAARVGRGPAPGLGREGGREPQGPAPSPWRGAIGAET